MSKLSRLIVMMVACLAIMVIASPSDRVSAAPNPWFCKGCNCVEWKAYYSPGDGTAYELVVKIGDDEWETRPAAMPGGAFWTEQWRCDSGKLPGVAPGGILIYELNAENEVTYCEANDLINRFQVKTYDRPNPVLPPLFKGEPLKMCFKAQAQ